MAIQQSLDDREKLAHQTERNLQGLELEGSGRVEAALALYEQNVAEGFEGDWPYGRLVAAYERSGELERAAAVLERAIEVFGATKRRPPADRRATVRVFKGRLRLVKRAIAARDRAARKGGRVRHTS
jgi:tetratricopeptide (TPR) repeat protein